MEIQNKFQNAKIYKITDIGYNKCYIGSTCEELSQRMARHRRKYKSFLSGSIKDNTRSFDLFNEYGVENCKIELIEYFPCDTLQELRKQEGLHIKNTECVNKKVEGRTKQEWHEDNKDRMKEHYKEYREQNKDKIKEYRDINKEKMKEWHKEYREQNKYKIKEKLKKYYENNKEKIKETEKNIENKTKIK